MSIIHGIASNDPKGEEGGTRYYLETRINGVVDRVEWTLLDQLKGNNSYLGAVEFSENYYASLETKGKSEVALKAEAERKEQLEKRKGNLPVTAIQVISEVLETEEKLVQAFINGNDKSLHALVGKSLKVLKSVDPLAITTFIRNKLKPNESL